MHNSDHAADLGVATIRGLVDGITGTTPDTVTAPESSPFQKTILHALPRLGKHVYAGTVTPAEKTRRRAATKAQRVARRQNRSSK